MTINKQSAGSIITALGSILVIIASFLKFYTFELEGKSAKLNLKDITKYCKDVSEDIDISTFNPHVLFIILAAVGLIVAVLALIKPELNTILSITGIAAGTALLIVVLNYGTKGALGDLKDYIESTIKAIKITAEYFGYDGEFESSSKFCIGYYLTIAGSITMILGSVYSFVIRFISPSGNRV